jgi:hypothetical protein
MHEIERPSAYRRPLLLDYPLMLRVPDQMPTHAEQPWPWLLAPPSLRRIAAKGDRFEH